METTAKLDHFLRFVQHNLERPCYHDKEGAWDVPGVANRCQDCNGTGHVPRPEAVELQEALTVPCLDHTYYLFEGYCHSCDGTGRVPRSGAEQYVVLVQWFIHHGYEIHHMRGWVRLLWHGSWQESWQDREIEGAAEAAFLSDGWSKVESPA